MSPEFTAHKSQVRSEFDGLARAYLEKRDSEHFFRAQKRIVLEMVGAGPGRVLDIGCGPAVMARDLLDRNFDYWGIDASLEMIRLGRGRVHEHPDAARCRLDIGDAEQLRFDDASFDCVISMGVLEYLRPYTRALSEIQRVLRPGGTAVLTVPNRKCAYHMTRRLYDIARSFALRPPGRFRLNRCVPADLDAQLAQAGLTKIESRSCKFIFFPLAELSEGVSVRLDQSLQALESSPTGEWFGTQYIVKVVKPIPA